jgi:hypothetical protein
MQGGHEMCMALSGALCLALRQTKQLARHGSRLRASKIHLLSLNQRIMLDCR